MFKRNVIISFLALAITLGTINSVLAQEVYNDYYYVPDNNYYYSSYDPGYAYQAPQMTSKAGDVIRDGAYGAAIGAILPSDHHGTGAWKGAAVGALTGLFFGR